MVTIGVHGFDGESFLQRLRHADVRLLLDVRQRRGVRGPEYAWANSRRLQAALAHARIAYEHHRELAPTIELRQLQYVEDDRRGVGKRSRRELAAEQARPTMTCARCCGGRWRIRAGSAVRSSLPTTRSTRSCSSRRATRGGR
ncbi:DUF488 family protein [Streptosporangium sp. CA-135522]|uniref:DUF488 family protein n=1 Tax=Streptosporangium sp. CA-135522 TaxID=3240072 RepID=UPI003D89EC8D